MTLNHFFTGGYSGWNIPILRTNNQAFHTHRQEFACESKAGKAGFIAGADFFSQLLLPGDPLHELFRSEALGRLWCGVIDLSHHHALPGVNVDAQFDYICFGNRDLLPSALEVLNEDFVFNVGDHSIVGCSSFRAHPTIQNSLSVAAKKE